MNRDATACHGATACILREAAHARTGDKGDVCNIGLVAWDAALYPLLVEQVTPDAVAAHFRHRRPRAVRRYLLPRLAAMNLVMEQALDGGVNRALNLDAHGKSLAFLLLSMPIEVPAALRHLLRRPQGGLPNPFHVPHARSPS